MWKKTWRKEKKKREEKKRSKKTPEVVEEDMPEKEAAVGAYLPHHPRMMPAPKQLLGLDEGGKKRFGSGKKRLR